MKPATPIRAGLVFFLCITAISIGLYRFGEPMTAPELDARRYTDYALNLLDFGTFGLTGSQREKKPEPGYANSPLYPAFLSVVMRLDPNLAVTLRCEMSDKGQAAMPPRSSCPANYQFITALQLGFAAIAVLCVWLTTQLLFGRLDISWLAGLSILATTKPNFFAHRLLTENMVLLFFAVLMLCLTLALQRGQYRWWSLVGVTLALLALTRPEYLYLFYAFSSLAVLTTVRYLQQRYRRHSVSAAVLIFSGIFVLAPWMARNYHYFDTIALTGGYGDKTIAYRAAYNGMSEQEWKAAFIYWLPGFGDQLAAKFLAPESYQNLGTDANSYLYKRSAEIFDRGLIAVNGDRARLTGHLLKTEIINKPVAHVLSSIPLAWRGVLTGKYLAALGLPCFVFLLFFAVKRKHVVIIALSFPALFMVALYAGISVSIPRYNIYLIYYYGIAVAWFLVSGVGAVIDKFFTDSSSFGAR